MEKIVLEICGSLENFAQWLKVSYSQYQATLIDNQMDVVRAERDYSVTEKEMALQDLRMQKIELLAPKEEPIKDEPTTIIKG